MKRQYFYTAMYLRLSRDDGDSFKSESGSITNQKGLIRDYIRKQPDMELYDIYSDDGFSGSNFLRPEFKRMIADIEAGRVNCVIVKDLSRFGRDYIETGRYLQKIFPSLGVRFIALADNYDSFFADRGESSIVLPVKNFINDSYCRDISVKVKSGLEARRRNGEFISPFAVYGYAKDPEDKNHLIIDEYAAVNVRNIFKWKIEGMAVSAIVKRLDSLGVLPPREYKKSMGVKFNGGFSGTGRSLWSSASVKRILTNEVYLGHLVQGKSQKINYKVQKVIAKPEKEWIRAEHTHEAIITEDDFNIVQNLLKSDSRKSPDMNKPGRFAGLLFCGDCGEQMVRRVNHYKGKTKVYYICSTKNRGEGCSRHSIKETVLTEITDYIITKYANIFMDTKKFFNNIEKPKTGLDIISVYNKEILRLKEEQNKYYKFCQGLNKDLKDGVITKEELERLYNIFNEKARKLEQSCKEQENLIEETLQKRRNCTFRINSFGNIDRHTLSSMVKRIYIYEGRRIEIEFYFTDTCKIMAGGNLYSKDIKKEGKSSS